jgi:hypothetical protein
MRKSVQHQSSVDYLVHELIADIGLECFRIGINELPLVPSFPRFQKIFTKVRWIPRADGPQVSVYDGEQWYGIVDCDSLIAVLGILEYTKAID